MNGKEFREQDFILYNVTQKPDKNMKQSSSELF